MVADRWTVGARVEVRGALHVHRAAGEHGSVQLAVWRYRGAMPLPRFLRRLQSARDTWIHLRHGNLMTVFDGGRITGETTCFWVQEERGGTSLASRLADHPRLAPDVALHIALQVALALRQVHGTGVPHGDLDPANVRLFGNNDRVRLGWPVLAPLLEIAGLDSGRGSTRSITEVAPEVLAGSEVTPESDRYALGALLFRMVCAEPPFLVRPGEELPGLDGSMPLPPMPEGVPKRVQTLLESLLQRDPDRRPADTESVVHELTQVETSARNRPVPSGAWAPTPGPPPSRDDPETPPTVQRTLTPAPKRSPLDAALVNVPTYRTPTPVPPVARSTGPDVRLWLLAGTVVLLTVLMFAVWGSLWLNAPDQVARAPAAASGADASDGAGGGRPPASSAPAAVGPSVLTLRTDPPGALVFDGATELGMTPLEIVLDGGPADPPREFVLKHPGYAAHTVRQPWSPQDVQHTVPMQRLARPSGQPVVLPPIHGER